MTSPRLPLDHDPDTVDDMLDAPVLVLRFDFLHIYDQLPENVQYLIDQLTPAQLQTVVQETLPTLTRVMEADLSKHWNDAAAHAAREAELEFLVLRTLNQQD